MKRFMTLWIMTLAIVFLNGCLNTSVTETPTLTGLVAKIENSGKTILVTEEAGGKRAISFTITDDTQIEGKLVVGSIVEVAFSGPVMESYPEQTTADTIKLIDDTMAEIIDKAISQAGPNYYWLEKTVKRENEYEIYLIDRLSEGQEKRKIIQISTQEEKNPEQGSNEEQGAIDQNERTDEDEEQAITELITTMSLQEKIGQMFMAGIPGTSVEAHTRNLINDYKIGGLIFFSKNLKTPQQTLQLLNTIKAENANNPLPLFLSVDQEGGRITRLPGNIIKLPTNQELGDINDPQFSYQIGSLLGEELNAFGFNLNYAPVLDINSNPKNPVIGDRSFGNNVEVVSKLGIQTMKGIQSQHIISVIKHFPGHGDTSVDSHYQLPIVDKSLQELYELELIPFREAIENGADVVMVAHILLPKLDTENPSSLSKFIITDLLRNQLQFEGVVVTDDLTMKAISNHYPIPQASVEAVKAGTDIIMIAHNEKHIVNAMEALKKAVENGEISEERIDSSLRRIINLKRKYGIHHEMTQGVQIKELNDNISTVLKKYLKKR